MGRTVAAVPETAQLYGRYSFGVSQALPTLYMAGGAA